MNLSLLQVFQSAVNAHSAVSGDSRIGMAHRDDNNECFRRVELSTKKDGESNREVRRAFSYALTSAFGVSRLDELPQDVKKVLKIGDFKESKAGEVESTRPLTMRRIRAVLGAVQDLAKSAVGNDDAAFRQIETAFSRNLADDHNAVETALERIAIAEGRLPMSIAMPDGKKVKVPLAALTEYTKGIPKERLAASVDDLREDIQNDIRKGAAIYGHLIAGQMCTHSAENVCALRHYLSFVALAGGKGLLNRVISVPDPNGMVAEYLGKSPSFGKMAHLKASDSISGSTGRAVFVSDVALPGSHAVPRRQGDLDRRYRKLTENPFASRLLQRLPDCGEMTVSQMLANVKAEFLRIATVEEDELRLAVEKELGHYNNETAEGLAEIGGTKARNDYHEYHCMLNEFMIHLQFNRTDLDHPEFRVGDETVLTKEEIEAFAPGENNNEVLSPRNRNRAGRREMARPAALRSGDVEKVPVFPDEAAANRWRRGLIEKCGDGDLKKGFLQIVRCLDAGCLPPNAKSLPDTRRYYNVNLEMPDIPEEFKAYFKDCDNEWFANLAWYAANGCKIADDRARLPRRNGPHQTVGIPIWDALCRGVIDRSFPAKMCKAFASVFADDDPSDSFENRAMIKAVRTNVERFKNDDPVAKAAASVWGFGTYDVERILRYVENCGYNIYEMSVADIEKLSTIAALNDFRLEDPMFVQRQTGKHPSEITTADLVKLFKLKRAGRLNDKGMNLRGAAGDVAAVLKGDKLPSMTSATGKDVSRLLSVMRKLVDNGPGDSRMVEFLGQKVVFRLLPSGTMVFNVAGFEFCSAKAAREFVEILEDDAVSHTEHFGQHIVLKMLPQIRGAELSADPVTCSRSRELCLRYLKGAVGVDPSTLASVGTKELFRIAEGVADDRYRMRSGMISERALNAMLDRHVDVGVMTSTEAAELCNAIQDIRNVGGVRLASMVGETRKVARFRNENVRIVHELLADLVLDFNTLDFDRGRKLDPDARTVVVMKKHIRAMAVMVKNPEVLMTFPPAVADRLRNMFGVVGGMLPGNVVRQIPDALLEQTLMFMLDVVGKPRKERERAVDSFLAANLPPPRRTQAGNAGFMARTVGGLMRFIGLNREVQPQVETAAESVVRALDREMMLDALDRMSQELVGFDRRIEDCVVESMKQIQGLVAGYIDDGFEEGVQQGDPVWALQFDEIVGNAMMDSGSGYGRFMYKVLSTYFTSSSILEQRQMMASLIRHVNEDSSNGAMVGALFKGAGPLLQKMLQGLPPSSLGPDLAEALRDMKSNLLPIPEEFVKASMRRIIDRSQGSIRSITVDRSLGAASVGQAFLCTMYTDSRPAGEKCVVKLLRPTVKSAIARERAIFETAAAEVPGMSRTFAGQLARILEELDFTLEASNINFGRNVYEQPVYLRQESLFSGGEMQTIYMDKLHSMEVHPLATPTMDCLVLKLAPGETYDHYMAGVRRRVEELTADLRYENGSYVMEGIADAVRLRKELCTLYEETLKRQKYLIDLTKKWVHEGLFGNGFYHGDLHAGNIMTDGKGLTVIDFGNATHLTELERVHVLRMISAALVGWNEMFESSFKALLSEEGLAEYDVANRHGDVSRDLAEVLNKGTEKDVGMRIAAALMLLQKHGIEVPGSIYNFNQCQMRLGGTVDEMNMILADISKLMSRMSFPLVTDRRHDDAPVASELISVVSETMHAVSGSADRPFRNGADNSVDALLNHIFDYGSTGVFNTERFNRFVDEFGNREVREGVILPFVEELLTVRGIVIESGAMRVARSGAHQHLAKAYETFRNNENPSLESIRDMAAKIIMSVKELQVVASHIQSMVPEGRPESFLMAVGDGISDSLYTVRTTLGNITSIKLMNEQDSDKRRDKESVARMRGSDQRVQTYVRAHNGAEMQANDIVLIKDSAYRLHLPFDLPGLDGSRSWRNDERMRIRVYEALDIVIRRLLADLERVGVLDAQSTPEKRRHAVCIAMQYLVDREGGLFEAFGGIGNRDQQRILAEVNLYNSRRLPLPLDQVEFEARRAQDQCVSATVLFLLTGGAQIAAEGAE